MTPVVLKSTAVSILLLVLTCVCTPQARASIGQNSDMTHTGPNVIDRHHVDSLLFNKVVKKC